MLLYSQKFNEVLVDCSHQLLQPFADLHSEHEKRKITDIVLHTWLFLFLFSYVPYSVAAFSVRGHCSFFIHILETNLLFYYITLLQYLYYTPHVFIRFFPTVPSCALTEEINKRKTDHWHYFLVLKLEALRVALPHSWRIVTVHCWSGRRCCCSGSGSLSYPNTS